MSGSGKRQFKTLRTTPRSKAKAAGPGQLTADLKRRDVLPPKTAKVLPRGGKATRTSRGR